MLTYFRRIRKGLLEGGRISKYLMYAIGEIALVVIGILIALQINNWNEHRKDKIIETKALHDLLQEFKANKITFDSHIADKQKVEAELSAYLTMEKTDPNFSKRPPRPGRATYNPTLGMVKSIMNSNKIDKLKNDSLRYLLSNWIDRLQDFHEEEVTQKIVLFDYYKPYQISNIPSQEVQADYSKTELEQIFNRIHEDMTFKNIITQNRHEIRAQLRQSEIIEATIHQIISLLEDEVN